MTRRLRAVVVDDEEPARVRLRALLDAVPDIDVVAEASDGESALAVTAHERPDLLFLDIEMPGRTGMEVAAALSPPRPEVVFCTAYDQYAVDAFEHHAAAYLLKPVRSDRLHAAVEHVRDTLTQRRLVVHDLDDASSTQARLFPAGSRIGRPVDAAGAYRGAREVAGDYYDFLDVGPSTTVVAIGDVAGKGLPAALLMANVQAHVQALAPTHADDPAGLAAALDRSLSGSLADNRYVTLLLAIVDADRRELRWVNAGHVPGQLLRPDGSIERLTATGTAVGLLPGTTWTSARTPFGPGDVLLLCTDGIVEATSADGADWNLDGVAAVARGVRDGDAASIRDAVLDAWERRLAGRPAADDATVVVARVR